jgi:hypothetical protein
MEPSFTANYLHGIRTLGFLGVSLLVLAVLLVLGGFVLQFTKRMPVGLVAVYCGWCSLFFLVVIQGCSLLPSGGVTQPGPSQVHGFLLHAVQSTEASLAAVSMVSLATLIGLFALRYRQHAGLRGYAEAGLIIIALLGTELVRYALRVALRA